MVLKAIQEQFLTKLTKGETPVTVFLVCGIKLQGIIVNHDAQTILLRRDGHAQLIYKHAVSTVMPAESVNI